MGQTFEFQVHGEDFYGSLELNHHDGYGWQYILWNVGDPTFHSLYKDTKAEALQAGMKHIAEITENHITH